MTKLNAYFGQFGGQFVDPALKPALDELEATFIDAQNDPAFQKELTDLLCHFGGRPTPLTLCRNLTQGTQTTLYLKREDLMHGALTKPTKSWAKLCSLNAWERPVSSPKRAQANTVWPRLWLVL